MSIEVTGYDGLALPHQRADVWVVAPGTGGSWGDINIIEGVVVAIYSGFD